jgi:hypothetical protein
MLEKDQSAGFEWLDLPFAMTRVVISLLGAFSTLVLLYLAVGSIPYHPSHPPPPGALDPEAEVAELRPYTCGLEISPISVGVGIGLLLAMLGLMIAAAIVVWPRPRLGFLLTAIVGAPIALVGALDGPMSMPIFLLPLGWLGFAWWKVGPTPGRVAHNGLQKPWEPSRSVDIFSGR